MRNVGTHVNNFREIYSCCDFLVQPRGVFEPGRKHCSVWLHLNLNEAATDIENRVSLQLNLNLVALEHEGGNRIWLHSDLFNFSSERMQQTDWLHSDLFTFSSERRQQQVVSALSAASCSPGGSYTCYTWNYQSHIRSMIISWLLHDYHT